MARLIDNQRAVNQHAAPAKVLATLLDRRHSASARGRRDNLGVGTDDDEEKRRGLISAHVHRIGALACSERTRANRCLSEPARRQVSRIAKIGYSMNSLRG